MQVALILGANPRNITFGPRVPLAKDKKWGIVEQNVKSTKYVIHVTNSETMPHFSIHQVEITEAGQEQYISLFLKEEK